jgi:MFS family permease
MIGANAYPKSVIHAIVRPANQLTSTTNRSADSTATAEDSIELWTMAAIAFLVYYGNYMVAPLVPTFSHEFGVTPYRLGWLVPGYSIAYGLATLGYGVLSDLRGRIPVLRILLLLASLTSLLVSSATTARELIIFRILCGVGCGGMATIALAFIGDRYPYSVQGRPMGKIFGAVAAGMGLGSSLGPILNPLVGWRNEFRVLACGFVLITVFLGRRTHSFVRPKQLFERCRQITGLATFAKFLGMAVGSLVFERVMHISFGTALIAFAMFQILAGLAAIYAFRGEYPANAGRPEQNART